MISIAAPQLVVGISGESEKRVRKLFETAVKSAPCVLFIDEVDSISPHRETTSRDMERRIVAQLLSSLDSKIFCLSRYYYNEIMYIHITNYFYMSTYNM